MRSRGRWSGKARRAGLRRSNGCTLIPRGALISCRVSASAWPSSSSNRLSSSWPSSARRSEDGPNRSCRSLAIVCLSCSMCNAWSRSAARCASRSTSNSAFSASTSSGRSCSPAALTPLLAAAVTLGATSTLPPSRRVASTCYLRTPAALRQAPVDPLQQVAQLCRCDRHRFTFGPRPDELPSIQALGQEAQPLAVVPQQLYQPTSLATEHEQLPTMWILLQLLLNQQRQAIKATAHIGRTTGQPH